MLEHELANLDNMFQSIAEVVGKNNTLTLLDIGTISATTTGNLERLLNIIVSNSSTFIIAYSSWSILNKQGASGLFQLLSEIEDHCSLVRFILFNEEAQVFTNIYPDIEEPDGVDKQPDDATQHHKPDLELVKTVTNLNPLLMIVFIRELKSADSSFSSIQRFTSMLFSSLKLLLSMGKA